MQKGLSLPYHIVMGATTIFQIESKSNHQFTERAYDGSQEMTKPPLSTTTQGEGTVLTQDHVELKKLHLHPKGVDVIQKV